MRSTIKKVVAGNEEILVQTDKGTTIPVRVDRDSPFDPVDLHEDEERYGKNAREDVIDALLSPDNVPIFEGDRISFKKVGAGEWVVTKLLVTHDDKRASHKSCTIVEKGSEVVT